MTLYDPPNGWMHGFPRPYLPLPGETLAQTLLRDGYPQREIDAGGDSYCRFWTAAEEQAESLSPEDALRCTCEMPENDMQTVLLCRHCTSLLDAKG